LPVGLGMAHGLQTLHGRRRAALGLTALLLLVAVVAINHQRYFEDYERQNDRIALNTTEIADAIHGFDRSGGDLGNAWIIAWPYWIDTRGVGIELGDPPWNNVVLDLAELGRHVDAPRPRFYVLYQDDQRALDYLKDLFPQGWSSLYISKYDQRDFVMFYVPPHPPTDSEPSGSAFHWMRHVAHTD